MADSESTYSLLFTFLKVLVFLSLFLISALLAKQWRSLISNWQPAYTLSFTSANVARHLPPGPRPWPIIGNIFSLGPLPYLSLTNLSKQYGPVVSFWLGTKLAVAISSPNMAQELYRVHDQASASRPVSASAYLITHGARDVAFASYGPYWRKVRKLVTMQLLTPRRLEAFAWVREDEVNCMVEAIATEAKANLHGLVRLRTFLPRATLNNILRIVASKRYGYSSSLKRDEAADAFDSLVREAFQLLAAFHLADYIPFMRFFDSKKIIPRSEKAGQQLRTYYQQLIDEHREQLSKQKSETEILDQRQPLQQANVKLRKGAGLLAACSRSGHPQSAHSVVKDDSAAFEITGQNNIQTGEENHDFITVMLGLKGEEKLSDVEMAAQLQDMIFGGMDTSAAVTEWILSELVQHPEKQQRLREELQQAAKEGRREQLMQLPYLQAVVKEGMRRHMPGPLLTPHYTTEPFQLGPYYIPPKTSIYINAWAIAHDPQTWPNPFEFRPERFLEENVNVRGQDFRLLPFGSGRRGCVGTSLGLVMVSLMLARILEKFVLEPPCGDDGKPEKIDMEEAWALTVGRKTPLVVKVKQVEVDGE